MFDAFITKWGTFYQVPEPWIRAWIQTESSGNPRAYRAEPQISDASYGLMQLLFKTAKGLGYTGTAEGLYDPDKNIELGTKLLAELRQSYGENARRVYSAYNSGKPDLYLTSAQVGKNVERLMLNLEAAIKEHPFVASSGIVGPLIIAVLLFAWGSGKKGKK